MKFGGCATRCVQKSMRGVIRACDGPVRILLLEMKRNTLVLRLGWRFFGFTAGKRCADTRLSARLASVSDPP